ncbi:hypothetical protein THMIRHAM_21070 [Thiomicrorhabdus immobilis]|uniref:Type II secretion system protein L n=1 Tax=Thiomicrorhabdus immobilis TaxID=2791037 RepID=A0ABM7MFQ3_9GAMM|nr:type II secretion system protein GspL [Thiomicrorhabdus immobilis]BCN94322.1 hypothetical protein THMIRHAM_21070 [Thiomicrorhabdus immobilis]
MLLSKINQQPETVDKNSLVARIGLDGELQISRLDGSLLNSEETIAKLKSGRRLTREIAIVWLPTEKVVMTDVMVPGKRKSLWMAALPYALEEGLSEAVEHYHFVAYDRTPEGLVSVAIATHDDMKNWKRIVESYGLGHVQLVPDCFRIPAQNGSQKGGSWGVVEQDARCLVRTDQFHGFACKTPWYDALKTQMLNALETDKENHEGIATAKIVETEVSPNSLLSSHLQNLSKVATLSLSQLAYKANAASKGSWYAWRWVAVLTLVVMSLHLATTLLQTQKLRQQTDYTQQKTTELFKRLFPESKRIVNIKSQTLTYLKQQTADDNNTAKLVSVLQRVEPWFNQVKTVKVEQMQWQQSAKSKRLSFTVSAPSSADLQKIVTLSQQTTQTANNNPSGLETSQVTLSLTLKNVSADIVEGVIYVDAN